MPRTHPQHLKQPNISLISYKSHNCDNIRSTTNNIGRSKWSYPVTLAWSRPERFCQKWGVNLTKRQLKRATDKDIHGRRKLPFFVDPIERKLKI